jgi:hypothetical protein
MDNTDRSSAKAELLPGIIDRSHEHILLVYGDANQADPQDFVPSALVAPCPGGFAVQYIISADDSDARRMVREVQRELRCYLIESTERDPWTYAIYHSGTASNWYSRVHWCWQQGKSVHSAS